MPSQAVQNVRSRQEWAEIINADWRDAIDSILNTGQTLIRAKKALPFGEYRKMVRENLDFGPTMAANLTSIAKHPRLANVQHVETLPARWATAPTTRSR